MKLTDETAAGKVYDAAIKRFNRNHELFLGDVEMLKVQTSDYLDLVKIANAFAAAAKSKIASAERDACIEVAKAYNTLVADKIAEVRGKL